VALQILRGRIFGLIGDVGESAVGKRLRLVLDDQIGIPRLRALELVAIAPQVEETEIENEKIVRADHAHMPSEGANACINKPPENAAIS
jgi:hypothetical protein